MSNYIQDLGYHQDLGFSWGGASDALKKIGGGALDVVRSQAQAKGEAAAMERAMAAQAAASGQRRGGGGGLPSWAIPAGIGALALVAIMVMKKK